MGANMARRLLKGGHRVVVFNRSPKPVEELVKEKATGTIDLRDLAKKDEKAFVVPPSGGSGVM
jgi:6-phosphogluconate dehydrogenase